MKLYSLFSPGHLRILPLLFFCCLMNLELDAQVVGQFREEFNDLPWSGIPINTISPSSGKIFKNWTRTSSDTSNFNWTVYKGHTDAPFNIGPRGGNFNFNGNYFGIKTHSGNTAQRTSTLTSPSVDLSSINNTFFQFYYHIHGPCVPDLTVEIDDGSGWQQVFQTTSATHFEQTELYKRFKLDISNFGSTVQVRFTSTANGNCSGVVAIDYVFLGAISCDIVDDFNQTLLPDFSTKLDWTDVPGSQGYAIYYIKTALWDLKPSSFIPMDTVYVNHAFLPSSFVGEEYMVYVKTLCSNQFNHPIRGPLNVKPPTCLPLNIPYYNRMNNSDLPCWNLRESSNYSLSNFIKSTDGKFYGSFQAIGSSTNSSFLFSPLFQMDNEHNYLSFQWTRPQSASPVDSLMVYAKEFGTSIWFRIHYLTGPNFYDSSRVGNITDGVEAKISLDSASYGGKLMEFKLVYKIANASSPTFYIRNFSIAPEVESDLELVSAQFYKSEKCVTLLDSISLQIFNNSNAAINFQTHPTVVSYAFRNSTNDQLGSRNLSNGIIASSDTISVVIYSISINQPGGNYIPYIALEKNSFNENPFNDSLLGPGGHFEHLDPFEVLPEDPVQINNTITTTKLKAESPIFTNGDFIITEICHSKTSSGSPIGGWPTYLDANVYIEISGKPNSDLIGYRLEIWQSTLKLLRNFTSNITLGANGTCIIGIGQGKTASPNDFYYVIPLSFFPQSIGNYGYLLKDPNGKIVDAVAYRANNNSYSFPPGQNVHFSEWSGDIPSANGTAGIRLEGMDLDNESNWVVSSSSNQNPNTLNPGVDTNGVFVPFGAFNWVHNGNVLGGGLDTIVGPFPSSGLYEYIGEFNSYCGLFQDTAVVFVNLPNSNCAEPGLITFSDIKCSSALISWPNPANQTMIAFGSIGSVPGQGQDTIINSSNLRIENLNAGADYDFWLKNICGSDTSSWSGPYSLNLIQGPDPIAKFSMTQTTIGGNQVLILDASKSKDAEEYFWELGNGQQGSGKVDTIVIPFNGIWDVKLFVKSPCGEDSLSKKMFFNIGLQESFNTSYNLDIYPNPTEGVLNIDIKAEQNGQMEILLLDGHGKLVFRDKLKLLEGSNFSNFDLKDFAPGLYFVVLRNESGVWKRKVLVR